MLNATPSTNQTSQTSRFSTAPTSPTTVISSVHNRSGGSERPRTLYMVDGEIIGGGSEEDGSPRLELRWIDALRAPGAPGGYRTVVDVVEERRSGRLTVVNGNGRASLDSGARVTETAEKKQEIATTATPTIGREAQQQALFIPSTNSPTARAVEEDRREEVRLQRQRYLTPVRRKPVPNTIQQELKDGNATPTSSMSATTESIDTPTPMFYQRRKAPLVRPPIPAFGRVGGVTEKDLLDEEEDARRVVEGRYEGEGKEGEEGDGEEDKEEEEKENEMDWFWVDEHGDLRYRRCGMVLV
ncbi:MAG: hypothetical protein Q9170_007569 [Blastenia crenularia]